MMIMITADYFEIGHVILADDRVRFLVTMTSDGIANY